MTDHFVTDRELAEALLADEGARSDKHGINRATDAWDAAYALTNGQLVLQRLQENLLGWFGADGVDALLIRALERTLPYHPVLAGVERPAQGTLRLTSIAVAVSTAPDQSERSDRQDVSEGILALIAAILALISRLVGDDMMRHLVRQIWPTLPGEASLPNDSSNNNERSGK